MLDIHTQNADLTIINGRMARQLFWLLPLLLLPPQQLRTPPHHLPSRDPLHNNNVSTSSGKEGRKR